MTKSPSKNHPWRSFIIPKRDRTISDLYAMSRERRKYTHSLSTKHSLSVQEVTGRAEMGTN